MSSSSHRSRLYKQMALEVAVRNPERYQDILLTFSKYEGKKLDDEGILDIYTQLYLDQVIVSSQLSDEQQTNATYMRSFIRNNNTHNNEWGFPTGYQAAFTRYLKTLSEFGFIYAQYNEPLKMSPVAKAVVNRKITLSEAFALQSMRFWRKSPYRRVLNDFNYFDFVLHAIEDLNASGRKMSHAQFLVSLFSDNGNVEDFLRDVEENSFGADLDSAYRFVFENYNRIDEYHDKVAKKESSFRDYGNTVFRVLQLTGFITVEYSGVMLLSINHNRMGFLNALRSCQFCISEEAKDSETVYFDELGSFSSELEGIIVNFREQEDMSTANYNQKIPTILQSYGLNRSILAEYLKEVAQGKKDNRAFWFIQAPIKFELLLTLFLYSCYENQFAYKPNFKCDDAGIPYSHAPGNVGDIEVYNSTKYWLVEATLIRGKVQQLNSETINLFRHIASNPSMRSYMTLVAPYIHQDTSLMIKVGMVITMVEQRRLALFCSANNIEEFVDVCNSKQCIEQIECASKKFIREIKGFLNTLPEESLIYNTDSDYGTLQVAEPFASENDSK